MEDASGIQDKSKQQKNKCLFSYVGC